MAHGALGNTSVFSLSYKLAEVNNNGGVEQQSETSQCANCCLITNRINFVRTIIK